MHAIAAVERVTGLSKDTLRVWERRYGFPTPERDGRGERVYAQDQVDRLRLIKRLMDQGHRPGRLVPLPLAQLNAMASAAVAPLAPETAEFLAVLRAHDVERLRAHLGELVMRQGLAQFALKTMPELNTAVGDAWARGDLAIFEEHLYSHHVQAVLHASLGVMPPARTGLRVVLTTLPGEPHALGLLMSEALLTLEGAHCVALGTETPAPDIVQAVAAHAAQVVALSFSASFAGPAAQEGLAELRALLPAEVELWAGGSGATRLRRVAGGVRTIATLEEGLQLARERMARPGA